MGGVLVFFLVVGGIVVAFIVFARFQAARKGKVADAANRVDVFQIQLGVQAQARAVQDRLERMAQSIDTETEQGLQTMLREVAIELRRHAEHIEYGAIERAAALSLPAAEQKFLSYSGEARSTYNREVISRDALGVRTQQKELTTDGIRDEDGQFAVSEFFVVTILAAMRGVTLPERLMDAAALDELLAALGSVAAEQLVAAEVVWTPASLSDSMARDDMESRFPQMMSI